MSALVAHHIVVCIEVGVDGCGAAICHAGGRDLGKVHYGLALAYRQHGERYAASEADAQKARRGMCNGTFMQPSEWRDSDGQ